MARHGPCQNSGKTSIPDSTAKAVDSMGKVTEELITLIAKQIRTMALSSGTTPSRHMATSWTSYIFLRPLCCAIRRVSSHLRYRLEPFLEFVDDDGQFHASIETPPRVLLYVPLDRAKTQHALIEAEAAGVVMEPGGSPWQRNTRLKVLAERVFKRIAPDRAGAIAAEVEAGRRTLAELDWLADQTGELGAIKLIFGTTAVADVVLTFLSTDTHDHAILTKHALPELAGLCATELGLSVNPEQPIGQVRQQLCRSLLLAELALKVSAAGGDTRSSLLFPYRKLSDNASSFWLCASTGVIGSICGSRMPTWADTVQTEAQVLGLGLHGIGPDGGGDVCLCRISAPRLG